MAAFARRIVTAMIPIHQKGNVYEHKGYYCSVVTNKRLNKAI